MSDSCGLSCWVKTAWNAPHQASGPHEYQQHSPATKETMEQLAKNIYTPIRDWQTRLLKILPSPSIDTLIECELFVATLGVQSGMGLDATGEWVQFDALSYSWGRPEFTVSIKCNGLMFPTTSHFAEALRHFRHSDRERYLWTDVICINQYDLKEKGLQVQSMYKIFTRAEMMLGWLGPSTEKSYQLLNLLVVVSERNRAYEVSSLSTPEYYRDDHDEACEPHLGQLKAAMVSFASTNPWFSRTWIRQEIAAARNTEMYAGFYHFPWDTLASVAGSLGGVYRYHETPRDFLGRLPLKLVYPRNFVALLFYGKKTMSWSEAFFSNSDGFYASLEQDRVYALQNIVESNVEAKDRLFPVIAYDKPATQVYEEMMKRLLGGGASCAMLTVFENYNHRSDDASLPSWLPDPRVNQVRLVDHEPGSYVVSYHDMGGPGLLRLQGWKVGSLGNQKAVPEWKDEKKRVFSSLYISGYGDGLGNYDDTWTWSELSRALQKASYSFYSILPFADTVKCGNVHKHGEEAFATSAGQLGDLVVHFPGAKYDYLLRKVSIEPPRCIFLGPCMFNRPDGPIYRKCLWIRQDITSKSAMLLAGVKTKFHRDCRKILFYEDQEEFSQPLNLATTHLLETEAREQTKAIDEDELRQAANDIRPELEKYEERSDSKFDQWMGSILDEIIAQALTTHERMTRGDFGREFNNTPIDSVAEQLISWMTPTNVVRRGLTNLLLSLVLHEVKGHYGEGTWTFKTVKALAETAVEKMVAMFVYAYHFDKVEDLAEDEDFYVGRSLASYEERTGRHDECLSLIGVSLPAWCQEEVHSPLRTAQKDSESCHFMTELGPLGLYACHNRFQFMTIWPNEELALAEQFEKDNRTTSAKVLGPKLQAELMTRFGTEGTKKACIVKIERVRLGATGSLKKKSLLESELEESRKRRAEAADDDVESQETVKKVVLV